jgi:hypothetical protein
MNAGTGPLTLLLERQSQVVHNHYGTRKGAAAESVIHTSSRAKKLSFT